MTNICFDCKNAVPDSEGHGCPWSRKFEPIPGWTAEPTVLGTGKSYTATDTYEITDCPLFDPDDKDRHDGSMASVRVRCVETGVVYRSFNAAGRAVGRNWTGIRDALRNGRDFAYGYHWEVVKDDG